MNKKELLKVLNDIRESVYSKALDKLNEDSQAVEFAIVEKLKAGDITLNDACQQWSQHFKDYKDLYNVLKKACRIK